VLHCFADARNDNPFSQHAFAPEFCLAQVAHNFRSFADLSATASLPERLPDPASHAADGFVDTFALRSRITK
jgi:hypothetical protein